MGGVLGSDILKTGFRVGWQQHNHIQNHSPDPLPGYSDFCERLPDLF